MIRGLFIHFGGFMKLRGKLFFLAAMLLAPLAAAAMFYPAAKTDSLGNEIRLPANALLRAPGPEDIPPPIENEGRSGRVWSMRAQARDVNYDGVLVAAIQFLNDSPHILKRGLGKQPARDPLPALRKSPPSRMSPVLSQDGVSAPLLFASLPESFGDALDQRGRPLRWQIPENLVAAYSPLRPMRASKPALELEPAPPPKPRIVYPRGASHYRELVENFSRRYNLSTELVMAIIHSESDFSPNSVSRKSAMGLMQLMPSTASDEVHRFLYGRRGRVSFEQLSVPEINIRYGTAYLHILLNRYFQNVRDAGVREHCAIASYNLGPNRFLRLYGPTNDLAVAKINSMGPEEFYRDLSSRLPTRETRFYVEKVRRMKQRYAAQ